MTVLRLSQRHTASTGNNAHDYERRMTRGSLGHLWIPGLISCGSDAIQKHLQIGPYPVFEEVQQSILCSCLGLKTHIFTSYQSVPVLILDNHNYVLPHRRQLINNLRITLGPHASVQPPVSLIHIDQHADMNEPSRYLEDRDIVSLDTMVDYTRDHTTIASFIKPALHSGWFDDCIQVRSSTALYELPMKINSSHSYLLDIDLDFRDPRNRYSDQEMKRMISLTQELMSHASFISIATSPLFIDQSYALNMVNTLLSG